MYLWEIKIPKINREKSDKNNEINTKLIKRKNNIIQTEKELKGRTFFKIGIYSKIIYSLQSLTKIRLNYNNMSQIEVTLAQIG